MGDDEAGEKPRGETGMKPYHLPAAGTCANCGLPIKALDGGWITESGFVCGACRHDAISRPLQTAGAIAGGKHVVGGGGEKRPKRSNLPKVAKNKRDRERLARKRKEKR